MLLYAFRKILIQNYRHTAHGKVNLLSQRNLSNENKICHLNYCNLCNTQSSQPVGYVMHVVTEDDDLVAETSCICITQNSNGFGGKMCFHFLVMYVFRR